MVNLLINDTAPPEEEGATRFGGRPLVPHDSSITWPHCKACSGPMQFLGQLRVPTPVGDGERLLLLFMCQNNPGSCHEWDANAGGNALLIGELSGRLLDPPAGSETALRGAVYGARNEEVDTKSYDKARSIWQEAVPGRGLREVLGQLFGKAEWLQENETPKCDSCGKRMRFVAQLEEGPNYATAMNFGGAGCAYIFDCKCGATTGKMLWQC